MVRFGRVAFVRAWATGMAVLLVNVLPSCGTSRDRTTQRGCLAEQSLSTGSRRLGAFIS
jgi:hypothetical protein